MSSSDVRPADEEDPGDVEDEAAGEKVKDGSGEDRTSEKLSDDQSENGDAREQNDEEEEESEKPDKESKEDSTDTDAAEGIDKGTEVTDDGGAEESKKEAAYSTRGRSATDASQDMDLMDAIGALGDLGREKKETAATGLGSSFLSETLTEEERRTRTRYLPDGCGINMLRKNEIKSDMALARSMLSSAGSTGTQAPKQKAKRGNVSEDDMELVEAVAPEDDRQSDFSRLSTRTIKIGSEDLTLPSPAFVPPIGSSNSNRKGSSSGRSPLIVEAVTAFNPPRPPESVGAKKKHRMLRWERRPADIEVDLRNYRKTVQRTRDELKKAEDEVERVGMVENHLRRHFFEHLKCLNDEWHELGKELASVQQGCANAAGLQTSRTRSRGAAKGNDIMKDVLNVLKSQGAEIKEKGLSLNNLPSLKTEQLTPGVGGVSAVSFKDWDRSSSIKPCEVANGWILPSDKVQTSSGEGTVVAVHLPGKDNPEELPREDDKSSNENSSKPDNDETSGQKEAGDDDKNNLLQKLPKCIVYPLVEVKLPSGIGYFPIDEVESMEDPSCYSDVRILQRWKGMMEAAMDVRGAVDIGAMADFSLGYVNEAGELMDEAKRRLLPFGAGMLPTSHGRGSLDWNSDLNDVNKAVGPAFYDAEGVLGKRDNKGVRTEVRDEEDLLEEDLLLQAKLRQLKNRLIRQRRIRIANEKIFSAAQERSSRVESLVSEMRKDLKTLKNRLDEEVAELGISEEQAENILTKYYKSLDAQDVDESLSPKRRRMSKPEFYDDDDMEIDETVEQTEETGSNIE